MRSFWTGAVGCCVGLVLCGVAHAGIIQLTSPTQLAAGDSTVTFPSNQPIWLENQLSAGGDTLTFLTVAGFTIIQAGATDPNTGFPAGTNIAITKGTSSPSNSLSIFFSQPVTQVGFSLLGEIPGDTFTVGGFSVQGSGLNTPLFFGEQATGGSTISSLTIQLSPDNDDIGIGPVTFGSPAVVASAPEPGTLSLLAIGFAALGAMWLLRARFA